MRPAEIRIWAAGPITRTEKDRRSSEKRRRSGEAKRKICGDTCGRISMSSSIPGRVSSIPSLQRMWRGYRAEYSDEFPSMTFIRDKSEIPEGGTGESGDGGDDEEGGSAGSGTGGGFWLRRWHGRRLRFRREAESRMIRKKKVSGDDPDDSLNPDESVGFRRRKRRSGCFKVAEHGST